MSFSYKKLFKLLIDRNMMKKELCKRSGVSATSLTKLGKDKHVNTEILEKICTALDCEIEDIVEVIHNNENEG